MHAETGNSTNEEGAAEVDVEILRCPLVLCLVVLLIAGDHMIFVAGIDT